MDGFDLNSSEKADASELQRMIAIEQQKAQFQAQVDSFAPYIRSYATKLAIQLKLDLHMEVDLADSLLLLTNRFTQMVQNGTH
uniref:Uncharacterized protein n=1 Tax=Oncorhynchus kisutch TaxID=8019 RepID=A0A8C7KWB6_ONCKI